MEAPLSTYVPTLRSPSFMNTETAQEIYNRMEAARQRNYPDTPYKTLTEIARTVIDNAPEGTTDYQDLIKNVLYAMEYTNSNSVEEMIRRAEEDYPRRYQEMTEEQRRVCDNYRLDYSGQKADLDAMMSAEIKRLEEEQ